MGVALDLHQLDDLNSARSAHPAEVVTAEVDEHHMLGALLGVGEHLSGDRSVFLRRATPRFRAGDRMHECASLIDTHEHLG